MANKFQAVFNKIEPFIWQEISRVSAIFLFSGWVSLFYTRLTNAPVALWAVWIFSSISLVMAAVFGNYYRHTYLNQKKLFHILLPGFILILIISFQIIRYPYQWPFFSAFLHGAVDSVLLNNKLPIDFWHFFYLLILAWRGINFGRQPASSDTQQRAFIGFFFGIATFQILLDPTNQTQILVYFLVIFMIGLFGLPAARIVTSSMLRGGKLPKIQLEWIITMLAGALLFMIVGIGSSFLLNLSVAKMLSSLLISLFTGVLLLVFVAMTPLAYGFMLLFNRLMQSFMSEVQMPTTDIQVSQEMLNQAQEQTQDVFHQNMLSIQNYVIIAITIAIIIGIWVTLKRRGYQNKKPITLEEGSITDARKRTLGANELRSLRDRLSLPSSRGLSAVRIRWIYATLCHYGKLLDNPRKPAITPLEYQGNLNALFPEHQQEISEITASYIAVRYGRIPETSQEIKKLQQSWAMLEKQARQSLQLKKKEKRQTKRKR
ncbi:MAG: DUF4129 domain-containing protein [Anaerolineaceae bacterium]|nr:DUF4129 domain-containing protein [Anaerolineaceae bacterium]